MRFECRVRLERTGDAPATYRAMTERLRAPVRRQYLRFDRAGKVLWLKVLELDLEAQPPRIELSTEQLSEEELAEAGWRKVEE